MATYLQTYGCTTRAGLGAPVLYASLQEGKSHVRNGVCRLPRVPLASAESHCASWLEQAWVSCGQNPRVGARLGVILASTKGVTEDYLNEYPQGGWGNLPDPLTPVLELFLKKTGIHPVRSLCVSNACASSHAALFLAQTWLQADICDWVWVCAVDFLGAFIEKGFRALQAVCVDSPKPFSAARDGLGLGEAAAVIGVSRTPSPWALQGIALVNEGIALTRPSREGAGLQAAFVQALGDTPHVDLIIGHGTATATNDATEDHVFSKVLPQTPVTGTKWCLGHTMATSGALDVIAACEALRVGRPFSLATTPLSDPVFAGLYLTLAHDFTGPLNSVLVSSLGFGGMNAALRIGGAAV